MKRMTLFSSAAILSAALAFPVFGSYVMRLDLADLTVRSDRVVRAHVIERESRWCDEGRQIYTYTTLEVESDKRGSGGKTIIVRQLGGEVDGVGSFVAGDAHFEVDEEVVVFVRENPRGEPFFHLIGLAQGKFRVERVGDEARVVRDVSDLSLVEKVGGRFVHTHGPGPAAMSLEDLTAAIKAAPESR